MPANLQKNHYKATFAEKQKLSLRKRLSVFGLKRNKYTTIGRIDWKNKTTTNFENP